MFLVIIIEHKYTNTHKQDYTKTHKQQQ